MHTVTLGGVAVGASILTINGVRWWFREKHKIAALVPFLLAVAYGMIAILCAGGLLGKLAGAALWGNNGLGDLSLVYGVGGHTMDVTRINQQALTDGGRVVVIILTVVLVCLCIWAKSVPLWKVVFGTLAGIGLGLAGTVAGIAAVPLASSVNGAGVLFTAMLQ